MPVLEAILHQFPYPVLGFHSDNGSEFINRRVAGMLGKLLAEFTKSRASRTQDNALVEGKNGAVIRKLIGYGHIGGEHAERVHKFYAAHLNPYLNFHRPCGFATVTVDARGKRKRLYKAEDYATPYEKLKSAAGRGRLPQTWYQLCPVGPAGGKLQRHRMRAEDERSQGQDAAPVQDRIAISTAVCVTCQTKGSAVEMPGRGRWWKTLVSRSRSPKRDIEFPPAAACPWKSPTARFPHSHSADDGLTHFKQENETKPNLRPSGVPVGANSRKEIPVASRHPRFQDHLVLESSVDFSIILRLENAPAPKEP